MVVENIGADGAMLELILKQTYRLRKIPEPSWIVDHGGGDDICSVLDKRLEQQYIAYSVIDSDRRSPFDHGNGKANRLKKVISHYAWPLGFFFELPCREIENLITLDTFAAIPQVDKLALAGVQSIVDAERELGVEPLQSFWLYLDIKKGVREGEIRSIDCERTRAWIASKFRMSRAASEERNIAGHGGKVIYRAISDNVGYSALCKMVTSTEWQNLFAAFFDDLMWVLASAPTQRL